MVTMNTHIGSVFKFHRVPCGFYLHLCLSPSHGFLPVCDVFPIHAYMCHCKVTYCTMCMYASDKSIHYTSLLDWQLRAVSTEKLHC